MNKFVKIIALCFLSVFVLSACNTVHGFGQDVSKVGQKVENASDKK